jgi:uncharacterized protein (DUF2249 family)
MPDHFASAPTQVVEVDARFLQSPEPFERTIEALDRLQPGGELRLLIHREPHPLYQMLQQSGYRYRAEQSGDGFWSIRIRQVRSDD